jgi:hypothetical protein
VTDRVFKYRFADWVAFSDIQDTVFMTILAAEGIHGHAEVRLHPSHTLDEETRTCVVDGSTPVGQTIARVLTCLLTREFGEEAFTVEPLDRNSTGKEE